MGLHPGHTKGQISYHCAKEKLVFCGDSLFGLGVGRLFEGTPEECWPRLEKFAGTNSENAFPDDTLLYCAHEYSADNCKFLLSIPGAVTTENADARAYLKKVQSFRAVKTPTVPLTMSQE